MDYASSEYNTIYETQQGYEAPIGSDASLSNSAAMHQEHLQGGSMARDPPRTHYRHEAPADERQQPLQQRRMAPPHTAFGSSDSREQPRYGLGRSSGGGQRNRKGLLGLSNLGNTCYMNAALQCLTHTHGMQKYFRFCSHAYTAKGQSHRQKLLMSFAHWFERDWGKNVSAQYHSPEDILRAVQQLNPIFQGYAQQDSQEFLRCVLDNIHEELRRELPDDLHAHLRETFGIELGGPAAPPNGAAASSSSGGVLADRPPARAAGDAGSEPGSPSGRRAAASAASQFMQLCQSTEGVTDVGEIRLPATKPTVLQQPLPTAGPQGGSAATSSPVSAWECGSAVSSSSGLGPSPTNSSATMSSCSHPTVASGAAASSTGAAAAAAAGSATPGQGGGQGQGEGQAEKEKGKEDGGEKPTHFASIISELFQGHVVSTVRCLECQRLSRTKEPFQDVSVQIPNPNELTPNGQALGGGPPGSAAAAAARGPTWTGMLGNVTGKVKSWFYDKGVEMTDCLRKFCAPEYLVGKDKYDCEHCKRKTDGERRFAFKDLPEVLCIHIKRFRYDASWFNATKNSRVVTFPVTKHLDMTPYMDEPPPHPVEYRLIGLIQHIGSMGGGHYISYCQHKRKPQEWYEYDDLQVSLVSAEQVERAEPYVLFYQRVPSKGNKLDRQTFKSDHRRMQARVRDYLLGRPLAPGGPAGQGSPAVAAGGRPAGGAAGSEEAVAEEMRHHGPALRNLYRNPPAELDVVFVSKHWYVKLTTMSQPGPLDNFEYLCPHRLLGCASAEMAAEPFIPVSRALCQSLVQKYGGGPVMTSLDICPKCQAHLRAYNDRKQAEYDLVSKYDTKDTGDGRGWYLVDALWVNNWKRYVRADHVTDVHDICHPGPVSNDRLLDKKTGQPKSNLRTRIDYIGVNARVWWLFTHVHGGGPDICREDLDIFSAEHPVEMELKLEELKLSGATSDFARRLSHRYVDECKGDLELYDRRYGAGAGGDADMGADGVSGAPA